MNRLMQQGGRGEPAVTAAGLATRVELEALARALDDFITHPETIVSTPRIFHVWARTPLA